MGVFRESAPVREGDSKTVVCWPVIVGLAGYSRMARLQFDTVGKAFPYTFAVVFSAP